MKGNFFSQMIKKEKKRKKKSTKRLIRSKGVTIVIVITDKLGKCINSILDCVSVCPMERNSDN